VRAGAYVSLGWIAAAEGRAETATSMYQQALASVSRWQSSTGVASAIEGLAGVAILERRPERAALLLGAAVALRGTALPGDPDVTRTRAMALESLGDDGFERSYGMGLGMSAQKALESVST